MTPIATDWHDGQSAERRHRPAPIPAILHARGRGLRHNALSYGTSNSIVRSKFFRLSNRTFQTCLLTMLVILGAVDAQAEGCPTARDEIATDRPDVTNSSLVVPFGSFQSENGVNFRSQDGGQIIDGTNTRWRMGIAPCLELLMDLPTYVATVRGPGSSGSTDVTPAIKWQVSPIPGKIDLSLVTGVALPTGALNIAGPGAQPYLQMPWSWELHDGWGVSGMLTEFLRPADVVTPRITETTFAVEKKVTERASRLLQLI
jgi:Putative MetA-pathway of phenol degradation